MKVKPKTIQIHQVCYNPSMWYLYILETQDGRFYTGTTNNLSKRMVAHRDGKGAKFTRNFGFKKLLYTEEHPGQSAALKRERQIKSLTRSKKLTLIKGRLVL